MATGYYIRRKKYISRTGSERPEIGPGTVPLTASHIKSAITEMHTVAFVFWLMMTVIGVVLYAVA